MWNSSGSMGGTLLRFGAAAVCLVLLGAFLTRGDSSWAVQRGDWFGDFKLMTADGDPWRLSDTDGAVRVLFFGADWCAPCHLEVAEAQKNLVPKFAGEKVVFAFVSVQDPADKAREMQRIHNLTFPVLLDADGSLFRHVATEGSIPRTLILDGEGYVAWTKIGYGPGAWQETAERIRKLL